MTRTLLVLLALLIWAPTSMADVVAKMTTGEWEISVFFDGSPHGKDCQLDLVGETYQIKKKISLKKTGGQHSAETECSLFGSVQIVASPSPDLKSTYVIVEAARGGDGDHTGPILTIFQLTKNGFQKLGEREFFDATYHRQYQKINSITGSVYFTFCSVCDGPSVDEDDFYVPAKITIGCGGICVKSTLSKADRTALLQKFKAQKEKVLQEQNAFAVDHKYIEAVQRDLNEFMAR